MGNCSHPVIAYLLFLGGIAGIYVEFTHPGVVFPGVVGALCLLLFALSAKALPISAIGVLLILLGIVMFILEVKVTSFGMLTVGGLVCLHGLLPDSKDRSGSTRIDLDPCNISPPVKPRTLPEPSRPKPPRFRPYKGLACRPSQ